MFAHDYHRQPLPLLGLLPGQGTLAQTSNDACVQQLCVQLPVCLRGFQCFCCIL